MPCWSWYREEHLSEAFFILIISHCPGWIQNGQARALSMETIQAYERLLDIPGKVIFSDNSYLIIQQFAFQPEARPSLPSLVFSLHSMYNSALPGEYLELSLPTPPSSTENSSGQFIPRQVTKQTRIIHNEYLTPTNPASVTNNSSPPVTSTSDSMTNHARYEINLSTNSRSNGSDTIGQIPGQI